MTDDRIEKRIVLRAPIARVWQAISDAREFGAWFGVAFDGPFVAGAPASGRIVPTSVDPGVAEQQKPHEGAAFNTSAVEARRRSRCASSRSAGGLTRSIPTSTSAPKPTTLIEFALEEAADGVVLTITESGFEGIPLERRLKAFAANDRGWTAQIGMIQKYLERHG